MRELPYLGDVLNLMALHPEIVSFAERALETKKIALEQSLVWGKYPVADDFEMALHMDYRTTTLLYPNPRGPREDIAFLLYYVDVDEQLGATYVVANQHIKDKLLLPDIRPRSKYPELYRHERPVHVRAGSMLIYNISTCHRGSAITSTDRVRFSHHIAYQSDDAPWVGAWVWANQGLSLEMQRFLEQATTRQRELLGFPPMGNAYWNEETLAGVAARYPAMDMMPYLEAADIPQKEMNRLRREFRQPRLANTALSSTSNRAVEPSKDVEQSIKELARDYYRGVADYCAIATGVPADYWMTQLLEYSREYFFG
jgi:hypothetical protein